MQNNAYSGFKQRKRSGCLGLWLVAGMIFNPVTIVLTIIDDPPVPVICFTGFFGFINFLCFLAIWRWEKWGVHGLYISFSITLLLSLASGDVLGILQGLVPLSFLFFLTRPVLYLMD